MKPSVPASYQNGVALIAALLTVALVALLASQLFERSQLALDSASSGIAYTQAQILSESGIDYARAVLAEDSRQSNIDHEDEAWARPLPLMSVDLGKIGGQIEDLQGRWNLNNLVLDRDGQPRRQDTAALTVYRRLLTRLSLAPELADNLMLWLGTGETASGQIPSVLRTMGNVENLRSVPGYDATVLERLLPYVTAVPGSQGVNINTAPAPVLAALFPELDLTAAEAMVQNRRRLPARDVTDFLHRLPFATPGSTVAITTSSQHFQITVKAEVNSAQVVRRAVVRRSGAAWPIILRVSSLPS